MLKKTITFMDLDDNPVTEDFYFNLSKAEVAEMEISFEGGFAEHLRRIGSADKPDGALIMKTFKDIILKSVGRRSEDGRRFIKNQEIADEFFQSEAYSEFFMELCTDAEAGARFVAAVMPKDLQERLEQGKSLTDVPLPEQTPALPVTVTPEDAQIPAWKKENRKPTSKELQEMSPEELREAWKANNGE